MEPPKIHTERLNIRPLAVVDAANVYAYRSLPAVYRYQNWLPNSAAEVAQFIARMNVSGYNLVDTWFQLGLVLRDNDRLIGDIGLHFLPPNNEQTEIGFTVSPEHQRRGYALEAVTAVMDHAFQQMNKHRIVAGVDPNNAASISILGKLGMRREGHFRKSVKIRGIWEDDLLYAMLREEWLRR